MSRMLMLMGAVAALVCVAAVPAVAQEAGCNECAACDSSALCADCNDCDPGWTIQFCTCPGLEVGGEILFMKAHTGSPDFLGIGITDFGSFGLDFPENDYDPAARVWVGWVNDNGLGVRARWFQFDQSLGSETFETFIDGTDIFAEGGLEVESVDIEIAQQFSAGLFEANVGGGIRYGKVRHDFALEAFDPDESLFVGALRDFEGVGPTMFAEFRRPLGCSNLALLANVRYSVLFGEDDAALGAFYANPDDSFGVEAILSEDVVVGVGEIQLGAEYSRDLDYGRRVFVRGMFEAQQWSGVGVGLPLFTNDIGLIGFTTGIGLEH